MNDIEFTLPVCKGTAFLRRRLSDARMDVIDDTRTTRLPEHALATLYRAWEDKSLAQEAGDDETTRFLIARGITAPDIRKAAKEADRMVVATVVRRWSNVYGPDDDDRALVLPDDIPELDPDDFDALLLACYQAVAAGRADPNAGAAPSSGPSSAADDTTDSPETSETPSTSTRPTVVRSA